MRVVELLSIAALGFLSVPASQCDAETCSDTSHGSALVQSAAKLSSLLLDTNAEFSSDDEKAEDLAIGEATEDEEEEEDESEGSEDGSEDENDEQKEGNGDDENTADAVDDSDGDEEKDQSDSTTVPDGVDDEDKDNDDSQDDADANGDSDWNSDENGTQTDEEDGDDAEGHTEYHVVCHQHGCQEVKAKLQVLRNKGKETQAALTACGKERSKLESSLQAVAQERGKVEADLAKCGVERSALQKKVQECGVNRGKLAQALGKCATERAALEQELKQCAEVDRPIAEKALRECGVARAALEEKLKKLAAQLSGGQTGGAAKSRRRRRRKNSLLETATVEATGFGDSRGNVDANATLHAEIVRVEDQLRAERRREDDLTGEVEAFGKKLVETQKRMDAVNGDFDRIMNETDATDKEVREVTQGVANVEVQLVEAAKAADGLRASFDQLNGDSQKLAEKQANAAQTLYENGIAVAKAQLQLLAMIQTEQTEREVQLRREDSELSTSLVQKKRLVAEKTESEEDCDDLRADVITLSGQLEIVETKLQGCLSAKKEIRAKVEHAQKALSAASEGLQQCLSTKTKLTAALTECKDRCAKTQTLLTECLSRKKVLAVKIKECHEARDLARQKLQECLDRKDELKEKIADLEAKLKSAGLLQSNSSAQEQMTLTAAVQAVLSIMHGLDVAEAKAEVDASIVGSSEKAVEKIEDAMTHAVDDASKALADSADAMQAVLQAGSDMAASLQVVEQNLNKAKEDDAVADAEAHSVDGQ